MTTPKPRAGRPRDMELEKKLLANAIGLYADTGWSGFNFDVLAKRSGVGKAALYLRWQSKEALLVDAFNAVSPRIFAPHMGDIHGELVDIARQVFQQHIGEAGRAWMRLRIEREHVPEQLAKWHDDYASTQVLAARAIVRAAKRRGELPLNVSTTLLLETINGALLIHIQATPRELHEQMIKRSEKYIQELVTFVLKRTTP